MVKAPSQQAPRNWLMQYITLLKSAIQARRRGRPLLLFLDYDGTLVEIASHPDLALPTPELINLLHRLTARADLKVMVVSGRSVRDLQGLLPVPELGLIGSHGGEASIAPYLQPLRLVAAEKDALLHWRSWLAARLQAFPGWWIEDKPLGFALHYRQVPREHLRDFMAIQERWQERVQSEKTLQLLAGRKVLEILPQGVSKGAAIKKILLLPEFSRHFPIYVGDDLTDESAFHLLQGAGLTIKVGRTCIATAASHFLPHPEAVRLFLSLLAYSSE